MYANGAGGGATARTAYHIPDRKHRAMGREPKKAGSGAERVRNAFLTQRLHQIAPVTVTRHEYRREYNYITRENYEYLLASAMRYAELLRKRLGHDPGLSLGEGIANLYRELVAMVGEDVNVNIETDESRLVFVLWDNYRWGECTFYWVPVKFVEQLNPGLRRIAISFLHQLMKTNGMGTTTTSYDFEMMTMWYDERSSDAEEEEPDYLARIAYDYTGGKVGRLMRRIETHNYYKRLVPTLDRYVPQSEYETELLELMKRGLKFIGNDKPGILSYAYDPYRDEKNIDDYVVEPGRMIMLTYDVDSDFENEVRSFISEEINNGYEIMAAETLVMRPDGDRLFTMDEYPTEFYKYLDDLVYFLRSKTQ